jgi:hypothetical protein
MFCWAVAGFLAGVFGLLIHDYSLAGKDTNTHILVSTLLFAALGLVLPWNILKRITAFVGMIAENTPFIFMILLLVLVIVFLYTYKWFLMYFTGVWLDYFPSS